MNNIYFKTPNVKKHLDLKNATISRMYDSNFITIQEIEVELGFFCTKIICTSNHLVTWKHEKQQRNSHLIFCFWIETDKNDSISTHFLNIINSKNDFSFQLTKESLHSGYIISISLDWINKRIDSNIVKNYLMNLSQSGEIKSLEFGQADVKNLIIHDTNRKWQLYADSWLLMGLFFEKIVAEIKQEKLFMSVFDSKSAITVLKTYINTNISKPDFSFKQLAHIVKCTNKSFEEIVGMGMDEYVKEMKLTRAIELLKEEKYTINEIAEKVGFSGRKLGQFSGIFKNRFGVAPSEYKKLNKKYLIN